MSRVRKLAFVVPRFEPVSAGGAEVLTREFARRLSAGGSEVEVLTTCARNHFTWQNYYEDGRHNADGLTINRFRVKDARNVDLFLKLQSLIDRGVALSGEEEQQWIAESVTSPDLIAYLEKNKSAYDAVLIIPYLFGLTYFSSFFAPEKTVLIPCLHDEPFARLGIFREMFNRVQGVMFNAPPEQVLAKRLMGLSPEKGAVVGMGFEPEEGYDGNLFKQKFGIDEPFLLYAGRRERGKNIHVLMEYFNCYKANNPGDLKLVLLGTGEVDLPAGTKDIIDLGYVDEDDKRNAHAAAFLLCQPSVNESFSIVLMDSWMGNTPVLVNGRCAVTKDHCMRSGGGLYFDDYYEFEETIRLFTDEKDVYGKMAVSGNRYVKEHYSWDAVLGRFENALERFGL